MKRHSNLISFNIIKLLFHLLCCIHYIIINPAGAQDPPATVPLNTVLRPDGSPQVLKSNNQLFLVEFREWVESDSSHINYCMAGVRYAKKTPSSVMWSFSRQEGEPVQGSSCRLNLSGDGVLYFEHDDGVIAWQSTNTAGSGANITLSLTNEGNLVLENEAANQTLWQSFDEQSIFLLPSDMKFTKKTTLFQRKPIRFSPEFNTAGNFSLRLSQTGDRLLLVSSFTNESALFVYHSLAPPNPKTGAEYVMLGDAMEFYDSKGVLLDTIASNFGKPNASSLKSGFVNDDGDFVVNYWNGSKNVLYFNSSVSQCEKAFFCGEYGLCNPSTISCSCPPGFQKEGENCKATDISQNLVPIFVIFHPQLSSFPVKSQDICRDMCDTNHTCNAALFDSTSMSCSLFPILFSVMQGQNTSQIMFLKISASKKNSAIAVGVIIGIIMGISTVLCLACGSLFFFVRKRRQHNTSENDEIFLKDLPRLPPRFSYKELQVATKDFSVKLGEGGFGSVYEGVLADGGTKVAVKKLDQVLYHS